LTLYFDEVSLFFIFFLWKMKPSHLTLYFYEGFFDFVFWWMLLTLALNFGGGFLLWLRILSKASHFDFVFRWRFSYFLFSLKNKNITPNFVFWRRFLWLRILMKAHTLTSYFDEGFIFFSEKWRLHTWLRILTKASHFDFVFLRRRFCYFSGFL
jgi:hypothetical protein